MDDSRVLHIFTEVADGRGHHGDFLKSFAQAVCRADDQNFALLYHAASELIEKYGLDKYLDSYETE